MTDVAGRRESSNMLRVCLFSHVGTIAILPGDQLEQVGTVQVTNAVETMPRDAFGTFSYVYLPFKQTNCGIMDFFKKAISESMASSTVRLVFILVMLVPNTQHVKKTGLWV